MCDIKDAHCKPGLHVSVNILAGVCLPCCIILLLMPVSHEGHEKSNCYEYGASLGSSSGTNNKLDFKMYQWNLLFYLTGMLGVTAVLDLSPPEPVEM